MATNGGDLRSRVVLLEQTAGGFARILRDLTARIGFLYATLDRLPVETFEAGELAEALRALEEIHETLVRVASAFPPDSG